MGLNEFQFQKLLSNLEESRQNVVQLPKKKTRGAKRPGRELECRIEAVFDQLNAFPNILAIRLEVRQARIGEKFIFCKKQPFDYLVLTPGKAFAFDAKECESNVWYPSKAPDHQRESLKKVQVLGFQSAFVVYFKRFSRLCWIDDFKKPAKPSESKIFDWAFFF